MMHGPLNIKFDNKVYIFCPQMYASMKRLGYIRQLTWKEE